MTSIACKRFHHKFRGLKNNTLILGGWFLKKTAISKTALNFKKKPFTRLLFVNLVFLGIRNNWSLPNFYTRLSTKFNPCNVLSKFFYLVSFRFKSENEKLGLSFASSYALSRSSRSQMFFKIGVPRKTPVLKSLLNQVAGLNKKRL